MKKSEVCVKLTRKNCKKVLGILEMFGEPVGQYTKVHLSDSTPAYEESYLIFNGAVWAQYRDTTDKKVVKPRELRNILAKEHLKDGDVCAFETGHGKEIEIRILSKIDDSQWPFECKQKGVTEVYANFIRYATDEEKALLEPKKVQAKEVISPEQRFSVFPYQTYTQEVWVNHYSDREFYVHTTKDKAEGYCRLDDCVQTVKATLTYDIPMTKV